MKVRIGVSLGPAGAPEAFAEAVDLIEQAGIDSLWLPENVYSPLVEPFTGMAFALSRTRRLKAGSGISVLPGRHPVLVAKQLASLAGLAPGRVLPVFGLLPAQPAERVLFAVPDGRRAAVFDESLELLRLLLTAEKVSFEGSSSPCPTPAWARSRPSRWTSGWAVGPRRAAAGRAAGRRLARLAADARGGGRRGRRDPGGRGAGRAGGGPRPLRPQPAADAWPEWAGHPGPAAGLDQPPPAGRRPGHAGGGRLGRRPPDDRASTSRPGSASSSSGRWRCFSGPARSARLSMVSCAS